MSQYAQTIAGVLIILVGIGCAAGCKALWGGKPESWPDVIANDLTVHKVSFGLLVVCSALIASGFWAIFGLPGAREGGAASILLFVAGGFLGNYTLFGNIRPMHTGPNAVIAAIILGLLWIG